MKLLMTGRLELESTSFTRPKLLLLLAYLSLEGPRSRRDLAKVFWPTIKDPLQGLRMALMQLNKEVPGALSTDKYKVWTDLPSDVALIRAELAGDNTQAALAHYRGPFLEGFDTSDIGEELEEWLYQTRESLAAQIREAHVVLGELAGTYSDYKEAANHAETAYLLRCAPEPSPDLLQRIYVLLKDGGNVHSESVAKEARGYGLELSFSVAEAQKVLSSHYTFSSTEHSKENASEYPAQMLPQQESVIPSLDISRKRIVAGFPTIRWIWGAVTVSLTAFIVSFVLSKPSSHVGTINGVSMGGSGNFNHDLALDDVDVGLKSGYFCMISDNLYLSSEYDNQSTAIRFRGIDLPKSTTMKRVIIKKATLEVVPSQTTTLVPDGSGFVIRGVLDASPWTVNDNCDVPAAENYKNRKRTLETVTQSPTVWKINQPYTLDITGIIQEMVDSPQWTGEAVAFAIDKLVTSSVTFRVYSFEGSRDDAKRAALSIEYKLKAVRY